MSVRLSPYHRTRQEVGDHDEAIARLHSGRQPLVAIERPVKPTPERKKGGRK